MSLCQKNCIYIKYDSINKKSFCQCEVLDELLLFEQNTDYALFKNIEFKKSITNLEVIKCIKLLFSKKGLIKNIGSYIILMILFLFLISSIIFYVKGYDFLCDKINDILNHKNSHNEFELNSKKKNKNDENKKNNFSEIISGSKKSKMTNIQNNSDIQSNIDISMSRDIVNNEINKEKFKIQNLKKYYYIDYEINNLSYEKAKENDKRTYFQYYFSLLKVNHILFFVLNRNKDYNSKIIKFCLLFFSFAVYLVINALFFNESLMHIIYIDKGKYNFKYNIPIITYSTIISTIIIGIIRKFSLSENNILKIKHETNPYKIKAKSLIELKRIIIKYICFFIISIAILLFFWIYLSSFCAVYKNTQIYLIKNSLLSYLLSLIYSFIICFFPAIFRICALRGPGKYLYDISQIIQLF